MNAPPPRDSGQLQSLSSWLAQGRALCGLPFLALTPITSTSPHDAAAFISTKTKVLWCLAC